MNNFVRPEYFWSFLNLKNIKTKSLQDKIDYWYKQTSSLTSEQIVKSGYSLGIKDCEQKTNDIKELIRFLQLTTEYEVVDSFKNKLDKIKKYYDN